MTSALVRKGVLKKNAVNIVWLSLLVAGFTAGSVRADEGAVARTNVCHKGTIIIKTTDDE